MRSLAHALVFSVVLGGCPSTEPEPEPDAGPPGWHTDAGAFLDSEGRQHLLFGINLSNDVKQPPHDSWATEADYARLQGWGMNTLRLLTGWAAVMPTEGVIDEDYLARYEERLDLAEDHGLLVIVDMHQDVFGLGFGGNGAPTWACDEELYDSFEPTSPWYMAYFDPAVQECYDRFWNDEALQDRFIEAFVAVAERVADRDHVVGFDLFNEPHWGTAPLDVFHGELLQPFYERVIAELQAAAPGKVFFAEAATTVQFGLEPAFTPFDVPGADIVYAPHYYDRGVHDEHEWDGNAAVITSVFETYGQTADRLGGPWLLGEYGGFVDGIDFDAYIRTVLALIEQQAIGATYWSYDPQDGGFGPLNGDLSEKEVIVDLLARVYPKVTSGRVESYAFDDVAGEFTLRVVNEAGLEPSVVLAFPAERHFGAGFVVTCSDPAGGWSAEQDAARTELTVTFDGGESAHDLSIRHP